MNISTYESKINALETGGGGGADYDLIIKVNSASSVGRISEANIVGGSFESAYSKAISGDVINVKIFGYQDLGEEEGVYYREFVPTLIYADKGYNDCIIINMVGLSGIDYSINEGLAYTARTSGGTVNKMIYASDVRKRLYITESGIRIVTDQ